MAKRKRKAKRRRRTWRARAARLLLLLAFVIGGAAALLWTRCGVAGCPDPSQLVSYRAGGAPVLLDRHGEMFTSLHPLERNVIPLDSLPPFVPRAFVAIEDRRFDAHNGVDWIRVLGAALHNLRSSDERQGASTITMQLARTVFPERLPQAERTVRRKLLETRVALSIEREFSKDAILELYLNHVYFGAGTHGIEAASRYYFGHAASELDLAEAALLAAMVRTPARTDPRRFPERALARRDVVLAAIEDQEEEAPAEVEGARGAPLGVRPEPPPPESPGPAPYFVETVRLELEEILGAGAYGSGLRIHTTLDQSAQEAAEAALGAQIEAVESGTYGRYEGPAFDPSVPGGPEGTEYLQGAVVVMDHASGEVRALVGGRDFAHSRFNRAISGRRPVGSAFKPFVILAALREGFVASQPIADRPFELSSPGTRPWRPENYDHEYHGTVDLRESLVRSLNIPIARLTLAMGPEAVVRMARDAGVSDSIAATPSLALGTVTLSPLALTSAYTMLATQGRTRAPRFIHRIEDESGRVIYGYEPTDSSEGDEVEPSVDPRIAFLVTDMLEEAVGRGTGTAVRAAGFTGIAAGKTGTTQEGADAWFVGYTPTHVASVWIGHDRPRSILPGASGGGLAAPVWGRMMASIEDGTEPVSRWRRPTGLVERTVDPETGMVVADGCRLEGRTPSSELFLEEAVPSTACPDRPGFFSRIAGTVRGWFGGDDDDSAEEPSRENEAVQALNDRSGVEELLGAEPLAIERR